MDRIIHRRETRRKHTARRAMLYGARQSASPTTDEPDTPPEPGNLENHASTPERAPKKRPIYKRPLPLAVFALVLIAAALGGGWYYLYARQFVSTDDAHLEGNLIQIAPQVAGAVTALAVDEHDHVEKGQLLVRIDPAAYQVARDEAGARRQSAEAALAKARTKVAMARADLTVAKADVEQQEAKVAVARTNRETAAADLKRYQQVDSEAVPRQKIDNAADRAARMKAELAAAEQRLSSKQAQVTSAQSQVRSARAGVQTAKADLQQARTAIRQAKLQLSYTRIEAPAEGEVARLNLEAGEYVQPGQALMAVVPKQVWVRANFKETQITHMRPGQPVAIHIDAYPERAFAGHVSSIQRGTGSLFSLLPPQNATGNFVKVVQRVPVKIVFDEPLSVSPGPAPGLSVEPRVKVLHWQWWPWADPRVVNGSARLNDRPRMSDGRSQ